MASQMRGHIIRVNKGTVPTRDHLEEILDEYDTCVSVCFIENGKFSTAKVGQTMSLDDLVNLFEATKDYATLAWFGKSDTVYSEDDIQPFMTMNDQMAVFLEAPFDSYQHPEVPDSKHSRAFYAFHEYFQPEIEANSELADHDLEKVVNSLRSNAFKRKMDNELLKEGGSCVVFANTKTQEINQWCTNTTAVTPDWGWTSSDFSEDEIEEETIVDKAPEPPVKASVLDKVNALLGRTPSKPITDNNVKNLAAGGQPVSKITETLKDSTATLDNRVVLWSPKLDPNYKTWSNKKKKAKYHEMCGQTPDDWRNDVECAVLPKGSYKPKGMDVLQAHPAASPKLVVASTEPITPKKPEEQFPDTASRLPVLSKAGHDRMDGLYKDKTFKKYLDTSSINVADPEVAAKIEKRVPFLEEQRGMKIGETLSFPLDAYEALASSCPEEAAILLMNRAGQIISMQHAMTTLGSKLHNANKELLALKAKYEPGSIPAPAAAAPAAPPARPTGRVRAL